MKKRKGLVRSSVAGPASAGSRRPGKGLVNPPGIEPPPTSEQPFPYRLNADLWEQAIEATTEMVSISDGEFTIVKANKAFARTFGRDQEDLTGKKCYEIVHGTAGPPATCPHAEAQKRREAVAGECYIARLARYFLLSVSPILLHSERSPGCIHIAIDITKQKMDEKNGLRSEDEREHRQDERRDDLTPRQHEILKLLCEGRMVKEIAFQLNISSRTVEFHKRRMMQSAGVKNFAELIRYAIRQHIVT